VYQTSQQQTNDVIGFGLFLMFMGIVLGLVKKLIIETESVSEYLPMTETKKPVVTVTCPICNKVIAVPDYNSMTRTDALRRHIDLEHKQGRFQPQVLIEGGERVPAEYRNLIGFLRGSLPEYSLMTILPAVEVETGEKKIDAVMKQLKAGVEGIQDSYQFRLFLTTMAKFHDYSIGNQILIMLQKPDAVRVAGFNTWKDLGRWVKKGERGIAILAPVMPPKAKVTCPGCGADVPRTAKFCPECGHGLEVGVEIDQPRFFRVVYVFENT